MNKLKNISTMFYLLIISIFLLSLGGCGYKADPFYQDKPSIEDKNIKFIEKEPSK